MLIQLSIENYRSIKDPITISMLASLDPLHQIYVRKNANLALLPTSLIIGTNGAGKSNVFKAVKYLQALLKGDIKEVKVFPHFSSKVDEPTRIDLQFTIANKRYMYGVDLGKNEVKSEYLYVVEQNKEKILYLKDGNNYQYDESLNVTFKQVLDKIGQEKLLLPLLVNYDDNEIIKKVYKYLTENVIVIMSETEDEVEIYNEALQDFKQMGVEAEINHYLDDIEIGINAFVKRDDDVYVRYYNGEISINEESRGVKKIFTLLVLINKVLKEGKVLLFDEFEKHMHQAFIKYFINLFNDPLINTNNAQLLFSAHNTTLLDLRVFRRDQIWLMDKNLKTMATVCYSLYEIEDVLENENIELGYLLGKYGATYEFKHGGVVKNDEESN